MTTNQSNEMIREAQQLNRIMLGIHDSLEQIPEIAREIKKLNKRIDALERRMER